MSQELQLITKIENDRKWLDENFKKYQNEYTDEFIAIKENKIIASDKEFNKLVETLKKKGENPALLLIKFIHRKGITLIW